MSKPEQDCKRSKDDFKISNPGRYNDISYFYWLKSETEMSKIFQSITRFNYRICKNKLTLFCLYRETGSCLLQGKAKGTFLVRSPKENYKHDEEGNPHMYTIMFE